MKQFLKGVLAATMGSLLALLVLVFAILGIMAAASGLSSVDLDLASGPVRDKAVLRITLQGTLRDRLQQRDLINSLRRLQDPPDMDLFQLTQTLKRAQKDDQVKGLFIHVKSFRSGLANAQALRRHIESFKKSGKFVLAYAENYSELAYFVTSAADEVVLYPKGYFEWDGLAAEVQFFKNSLKKLEVTPQVFRTGRYKSAIEPFIGESMSPESREQTGEILELAWSQLLEAARGKTQLGVDELEQIAEKAQVIRAQEAFEQGFVDLLASYEEVENKLVELTGVESKPHYSNWRAYHKFVVQPELSKSGDKVAIVFAEGAIDTENQDGEGISSASLSKLINKLRRDEDIKAIVFRVNSPGGSALASDVIWTSTQWLKDEKTVVTSFGNVAASGGYYMSAGSPYIFAEPSTITGSIGVFGLRFATKDFWNNKVGMTFDLVKTHRYADLESKVSQLDPQESLIIQNQVDMIYEDFLNVVLMGRTQYEERDQVHEVAQGRVWTGQKAFELGLVDELGGLDEAIAKAVDMAEITAPYVLEAYPKEQTPWEQLLSQMGEVSLSAVVKLWPGLFEAFSSREQPSLHKTLQMRLPMDIEIH